MTKVEAVGLIYVTYSLGQELDVCDLNDVQSALPFLLSEKCDDMLEEINEQLFDHGRL